MPLRQADCLGAADTIIVCLISFLTIRNIKYGVFNKPHLYVLYVVKLKQKIKNNEILTWTIYYRLNLRACPASTNPIPLFQRLRKKTKTDPEK